MFHLPLREKGIPPMCSPAYRKILLNRSKQGDGESLPFYFPHTASQVFALTQPPPNKGIMALAQ
ncbi:hypothetical protein SK128_002531 [Halocaridina rubra]|uniref:Uncharacterized protein n=1 Tax=Halocaridina rubra TaxID=373956 RepID=A0AAN8XAG7_HALRR